MVRPESIEMTVPTQLDKLYGLLDAHEVATVNRPTKGKSYFTFFDQNLKRTEILNSKLTGSDVTDIVNLWIHDGLGDKLLQRYSLNSLGSFLYTLGKTRKEALMAAINGIKLDKDGPSFKDKLVREQELWGTMNKYLHAYEQVANAGVNGHREIYHTAEEAEKRAALSLFRFGIITSPIETFANHRETDIFLTEFSRDHIPALWAARSCPEHIDSFAGKGDGKFLFGLGLIGAQMRIFGRPDEKLLSEMSSDKHYGQLVPAFMNYFYAGVDRAAVQEQDIADVLKRDPTPQGLADLAGHLISTKAKVHDNSYLAEKMRTAQLKADQAVDLAVDALDIYNGSWNSLEPHTRTLLESSFNNGEIDHNTFSRLVAACVGFDIDFPPFLDSYLDNLHNQQALSMFPSGLNAIRKGFKYSAISDYPNNPVYSFMSGGLDALPQTLAKLLSSDQNGFNYNILAKGILKQLFERYYQYYFGSVLEDPNFPWLEYPDPPVKYRDVMHEMWHIVHPDIWKLLARADIAVIQDYLVEKVPEGKVRVELNGINGMRGWRDAPLAECLHPILKILDDTGGLSFYNEPPKSTKLLRRRLLWTVQDPENRESIAGEKRQLSTDLIRTVLLPRYNLHRVDILTQIRLIHRAHMRGNEHIILQPNQARRLLKEDIRHVDRLSGVVRSEDRLHIQVGLADLTALCASYENTPKLLEHLAHQAELLFPQDGINPAVDANTIYYFASAFQLYLALIHPFYEANGRTSEDAMYILWQRRPDLASTRRYISGDGAREDNWVELRMRFINGYALERVRTIGVQLGATERQVRGVRDYNQLLKVLREKYQQEPNRLESDYLRLYDHLLEEDIVGMTDMKRLRGSLTIVKLAMQLRNAYPVYNSAIGPSRKMIWDVE